MTIRIHETSPFAWHPWCPRSPIVTDLRPRPPPALSRSSRSAARRARVRRAHNGTTRSTMVSRWVSDALIGRISAGATGAQWPPTAGEGKRRMRITRAQRNAVAERITSLERTFYGRGPRSVQVSVSDDEPVSLVVLSIDSLTVADAVLGERGHREAVIRHHEALHEATRADFLEAVE